MKVFVCLFALMAYAAASEIGWSGIGKGWHGGGLYDGWKGGYGSGHAVSHVKVVKVIPTVWKSSGWDSGHGGWDNSWDDGWNNGWNKGYGGWNSGHGGWSNSYGNGWW